MNAECMCLPDPLPRGKISTLAAPKHEKPADFAWVAVEDCPYTGVGIIFFY